MTSPTIPQVTTARPYRVTTSTSDYWNISLFVSSPFTTTLNVLAVNTTYDIPKEEVKYCKEWEAAQHNLFQTANIFFAAAFLVPRNFKQSLLLLRALLSIGFILSTLWAGIHVCAPDAFAWNVVLVLLNTVHTLILTCRILPPPLSIELTELYLKMFRPLRVSKKHFKELTREGVLMNLEAGGTYALQDITPADEKLSVLLKGKMKVTCDRMQLHYIYPHQFVDSPEWEANYENSDDVFQVTITAEEECVYMCWSRSKLERVFRHRPHLKMVLSNIIGKDITHKLYSLNEHTVYANGLETNAHHSDHWKTINRSLSLDEVHTGPQGYVRSLVWRAQQQRRTSSTLSNRSSPGLNHKQFWVPVIAKQFPATSPFSSYSRTLNTAATVPTTSQMTHSSTVAAVTTLPLAVPVITSSKNPSSSQVISASRSSDVREIKIETPV